LNIERALVVAAAVGAACGAGGYYLAWRFDLPVGAAQTLLAVVFVALAAVVERALLRRVG